jgi:hypothetical protein
MGRASANRVTCEGTPQRVAGGDLVPPQRALGPPALFPANVNASHGSAASNGYSQQERYQQRAERSFARDIAQDAERHAGLSTGFDRAADAIDRRIHRFGDFRHRGFRLRDGIQAFIDQRGAFIGHDQISKSMNGVNEQPTRSQRTLDSNIASAAVSDAAASS